MLLTGVKVSKAVVRVFEVRKAELAVLMRVLGLEHWSLS